MPTLFKPRLRYRQVANKGWCVLSVLGVMLVAMVVTFLTTSPTKKWVVVWDDEFSGTKLDATKWGTRDEAGKYNHELEYYAPAQVAVQNGTLSITSQRRPYKRYPYMSGAVETKGKFFFLYGRAEVCARLPRGKGVWPSFWLLPEDRSWPPEIDVMEALGQEPSVIHMTNYWGTAGDHTLKSSIYAGSDFSRGWHTYQVDWEPGMIRWYVDGVQRFASTNGVPDKPMYLILNTAVGGDFSGSPDATTPFPQRYEIRYVRVWQQR